MRAYLRGDAELYGVAKQLLMYTFPPDGSWEADTWRFTVCPRR
jgi:hypothetical protein